MTLRHRRQRADEWDWWEPSYAPNGSGSVHDLQPDEPKPEGSPVVLWLRDPEQWSGWREYYCAVPEKPNGKPKRRMGY
jgi:hypothetical protein